VPIATLFLVGLYSGVTPLRGLAWATLCTMMQVVPNASFFALRMRQGAYSDNDVSVRQQRTELYIVGMASMAIGIGLLLALGAPAAFVRANAAGLIVTVLCFVINLFWKISVHAGTLASCATVLSFFSTTLGAIFWGCALVVGWARVRTGNHTPAQVLAGFVVATACVLLVFRLPL
jgi:membrane-associated phospholipid phosphatase